VRKKNDGRKAKMDYCTTMVQDRKKHEAILEAAELKTSDDAIEFARALTAVIWDHQMLGLINRYYSEDAVLKGSSGDRIIGPGKIQEKVLSMIAAFPDMKVFISETFAKGDEESGYMVYQRSWCEGTNTGMSIFGPPTGNRLDEKNSMGQTVYIINKVEGTWKVVKEYSIRSTVTIEKLLKDELEHTA
jgi:hypothetical protein